MLNHYLARSRKNRAHVGGGSTILLGDEFREGGVTKKFLPDQSWNVYENKGNSGKMPDKKPGEVGHLCLIEEKARDILTLHASLAPRRE